MVEQYRMKAFYRSFYRLLIAQKQGDSYFYFVFLIFILSSTAFLCVYPEILSSLKRQKHEKPASDKRLARQRRVIRFLHGCKDNKKNYKLQLFSQDFFYFSLFLSLSLFFSFYFSSISLLSTSFSSFSSSSVSSSPPRHYQDCLRNKIS